MSSPNIEEGSRLAVVSRVLLITVGVVFLVPFLLSVISWERTSTALPPLRAFLLGACPLVSVSALFAAWRAVPTIRVNLFLAITSAIFAIYLGELLIPFGLQLRTLTSVEAVRDVPIDRRDKIEVLLDDRSQGIDAVTSIEPKGLLQFDSEGTARSRLADDGSELLPVGGLSRRHTVVCNEGGTWVTYESDRFGMNNPDEVWNLDTIDVATVGDSFTNGWCVPTEQHFTQLIRSRHERMINLAQSGHGPLLIYASIVEFLAELRPETVLWFHYEGNDFEDLWAEAASPLLQGYLDGTTHQRLAERQDAVDETLSEYMESELERWRSFGQLAVEPPSMTVDAAALKSLIKLDNLRTLAGMVYTSSYDPDYETYGRVLREASATVGSWGGELHLVYLPSWHRYRRDDLARRYGAAHDRVLAEAEELGIPVVDVSEAFAGEDDPLSLYIPIQGRVYGHFNERGNRIVAETVIERLRD